MARYTDIDALVSEMEKRNSESFDEYGFDLYVQGYADAISKVENATTADVVPRSEVERMLDDFQRSIRADAKVGMSAGEILMHVNNMLIALKKKYTEVEK